MLNYILGLLIIFSLSCTKTQKVEEIEPPITEPTVEKKEPLPSFANFLSLSGTVQLKRSNESIWGDTHIKENLYLRDWIKTGDTSYSKIQLTSGPTINMQDNTVILLIDNQKGVQNKSIFGVPKGKIQAEIGKVEEDHELIFKFPNVWVKLKQSVNGTLKKVLFASLTQNKLEVRADSGSVELLWKNKTQQLKQGQSFKAPVKVSNNTNAEQDYSTPPEYVEVKEKASTEKKPANKIVPPSSIKEFKITFPPNNYSTNKSFVNIKGVSPKGTKVFLRGQEIKLSKESFSHKVDLSDGINILTFQIFEKKKVIYKSIEVERK